MDKQKLKSIYYLNKEVEMWEDALKRIKEISLVPSMVITGLPFGKGQTSDKVGNTATDIVEIEDRIKKLKIARVQEYNNLLDYINTIEDTYIRQIMYYRHIACMNWVQVARAIGGNNTADGVRKAHDRHLKKLGN